MVSGLTPGEVRAPDLRWNGQTFYPGFIHNLLELVFEPEKGLPSRREETL